VPPADRESLADRDRPVKRLHNLLGFVSCFVRRRRSLLIKCTGAFPHGAAIQQRVVTHGWVNFLIAMHSTGREGVCDMRANRSRHLLQKWEGPSSTPGCRLLPTVVDLF
jgi:hypothetical protein